MKTILMAAAAVFFVTTSAPAFAQEATASASACEFEGAKGPSNYECLAAAQLAFQKLASDAAEGDTAKAVDIYTELLDKTESFKDLVASLDSSELGKGQPLRQNVEATNKAVSKAISAVSKLTSAAVKANAIQLPKK